MDINKLPERLFDLLISNSYDELSEKDKNDIQAYLTPEEYSEVQAFVQQFSATDKSIENSIVVDESILGNSIKKPKLWQQIINYPVPLYKVAAIFLVCIGILTAYQNKDLFGGETKLINFEKNVSVEDWFYPEDLVFEL